MKTVIETLWVTYLLYKDRYQSRYPPRNPWYEKFGNYHQKRNDREGWIKIFVLLGYSVPAFLTSAFSAYPGRTENRPRLEQKNKVIIFLIQFIIQAL